MSIQKTLGKDKRIVKVKAENGHQVINQEELFNDKLTRQPIGEKV